MSDPTRLSDEEKARQAIREQADEITRLDALLSDQYGHEPYPVAQPADSAIRRERLFSRKVLFGWAFAALVVVFVVRMVLPIAFETAKESIISSMKESTGNTSVPPIVASALPAPNAAPTAPAAPTADVAPVLAPAKDHPATTPKAETKSRK